MIAFAGALRLQAGQHEDARGARAAALGHGRLAAGIRTYGGLAMDKVFIEALEIDCVIGIYDWERSIRQPVQLDIEMEFDNRMPAPATPSPTRSTTRRSASA